VEGWWRWSQERDNVLFIHYEELLESPAEKMREIAQFLAMDLSDHELANAIEKSSYAYMKGNENLFEMSPPIPLYAGGKSYFVSGKKDRGKDIGKKHHARVIEFCKKRLEGATYPVVQFYPDVVQRVS